MTIELPINFVLGWIFFVGFLFMVLAVVSVNMIVYKQRYDYWFDEFVKLNTDFWILVENNNLEPDNQNYLDSEIDL